MDLDDEGARGGWKGSHHAKVWSVYDPHKVLDRVFDMGHLSQGGW